jgi:Family of unknown function (DUF5681)
MAKRRPKRKASNLPGRKATGRGKEATQFKPGQSGNPAGPKPGRNLFVEAIRNRVDADTAAMLTERLIKAAKTGSISATTFLMRHLPKHAFALLPDGTKIESTADAGNAMTKIAERMTSGELSIEEASAAISAIGTALAGVAGSAGLDDLMKRIAELKAMVERREEWERDGENPAPES